MKLSNYCRPSFRITYESPKLSAYKDTTHMYPYQSLLYAKQTYKNSMYFGERAMLLNLKASGNIYRSTVDNGRVVLSNEGLTSLSKISRHNLPFSLLWFREQEYAYLSLWKHQIAITDVLGI